MVYVIGIFEQVPTEACIINTTSRSTVKWATGLSPFFLGPVPLYKNYISKNVENGWQYAKVYKQHIDTNGNPTEQYFEWAKTGWENSFAMRYPMGKGARPEYSYWDGQKFSYVEARKKIYIPLYIYSVVQTAAYKKLKELYKQQDIYLRDFDGYNHRKLGMSYKDVLNNPNKKMGHAFVLAMMLELGGEGIKELLKEDL